MKKILIVGNSPLPDENTKSRPAAGLRTYQFLKPLLERKFNVRLVTIAMPECYENEPQRQEIFYGENCVRYVISKNDPQLVAAIQKIHDEFQPDAIIGVNTYPSYIFSKVSYRAPFWADLNGWVMAEAQAQAFKLDSNDYLAHYYEIEKNITKCADKFSTVSGPQKFALLGELASVGRLSKETFGYEFVHAIPNGMEIFEKEKIEENSNFEKLNDIPKDIFFLLWLGGYNTWVDEITLFIGVEDAMRKCEKLYFVSTGGEISGLDNKTFKKFKEKIEQSEFKDRFVFLGWVPTDDIPYIYMRADCGLNVDRKCMETLTGARNRLNEMMKFGLPVVTTLGSEISNEVKKYNCGICVESGKSNALCDALCTIYKEWRGGKSHASSIYLDFGKNGKKYISEKCNYENVLGAFLKWIENPRPAPDRGVKINFEGGLKFFAKIKSGIRYLKENGIKKFLKKIF